MFNFGIMQDYCNLHVETARLGAEIQKLKSEIRTEKSRTEYFEQLYIFEKNKKINPLRYC